MSWLSAATPVEGGLLIPGLPARHAASMILRPDGARIGCDDNQVLLTYETSHGSITPPEGRWIRRPGLTPIAREGDGWGLTNFSRLRTADLGVTLAGWGDTAIALAPMQRRYASRRNRFPLWSGEPGVPLWATVFPRSNRQETERELLGGLLLVLRDLPDWRAALTNRDRAAALVASMAAEPGDGLAPPRVRHHESVTAALEATGHVHPIGGRPLPGDPPSDHDTVLADVERHLADRYYTSPDAVPPTDELSKTVRALYSDVPAWPFASLAPDPPQHQPETFPT